MSTKLTIKEAVEIIPVSESSLRRAIKTGEISSEKDRQGRLMIVCFCPLLRAPLLDFPSDRFLCL